MYYTRRESAVPKPERQEYTVDDWKRVEAGEKEVWFSRGLSKKDRKDKEKEDKE